MARALYIIRVGSSDLPRVPFRDSADRDFKLDVEAAIAAHNGGAQRLVGEIVPYAGAGAPREGGWLVCDGSELNIRDYSSLFAVLGNRFGGDGVATFRIPTQAECVPDPNATLPTQNITGGSIEPSSPSTPTPGTPGGGGGNTVTGGRTPSLRDIVPNEVPQ